jgi:TrpR-related protein YerC/YecD
MNPSLTSQRFGKKNPDIRDLCRAIEPMKSASELEWFLKDLCTAQELRLIMERWSIAKLIHLGFPYRMISIKTGASSSTIARVSHNLALGSGELSRACKRRAENIARESS